jgi:hypothetical protein
VTRNEAVTERQDNPAVDHEESDVNVRAIFGFAGGLLIIGAIVHVLLALLFGYYTRESARGSRLFPLAAQSQEQLPPEPRLQTNPAEDMQRLRAREDAVLRTYGWVDQGAGVARIPIAEAMKLTVQRGLPTVQRTAPPQRSTR